MKSLLLTTALSRLFFVLLLLEHCLVFLSKKTADATGGGLVINPMTTDANDGTGAARAEDADAQSVTGVVHYTSTHLMLLHLCF